MIIGGRDALESKKIKKRIKGKEKSNQSEIIRSYNQQISFEKCSRSY